MAEAINRVGFKGKVGDIPSVSVSQGAADSLAGLANTLHGFSMKAQDRMDSAAAIESARQGAQDGAEKKLDEDLLYNPTIRGRSYTEAGINTYKSRIELDATKKINEITSRNATDPNRMKLELEAYKTGVMKTMVPDVKEAFGLRFDINSQTSISAANKGMISAKQKQADASALALENELHKEVAKVGGVSLSTDPQLRAAAQTSISLARKELIAKYSSTIEDAFGNKIPAFDPDEGVKALHEFDQTVTMAGISGWFEEQSEMGGGASIKAMTEFVAGGGPKVHILDENGKVVSVPAQNALTVENVRKVTKQMQEGIRFSNSQIKHEQQQSDRRVKESNKETLRLFSQAQTVAQRQQILKLSRLNDDISAVTLGKMQEEVSRLGLGTEDDPTTVSTVRAQILVGQITDPTRLPTAGLSDNTRFELQGLVMSSKDKSHFTAGPEYAAGRTALTNYFGIPPGGIVIGGGNMTKKQKRLGGAINDYMVAAEDVDSKRKAQMEAGLPVDKPFDGFKWAQARIKEDKDSFGGVDNNTQIETLAQKRKTIMENPNLDPADRRSQVEAIDLKIAGLRSGE